MKLHIQSKLIIDIEVQQILPDMLVGFAQFSTNPT